MGLYVNVEAKGSDYLNAGQLDNDHIHLCSLHWLTYMWHKEWHVNLNIMLRRSVCGTGS